MTVSSRDDFKHATIEQCVEAKAKALVSQYMTMQYAEHKSPLVYL